MIQDRVGTAAVACALLLSSLCACTVSPDPLPPPPPTVLPTPAPTSTPVSLDLLDPADCQVHLWHTLTGPAEAVLLELATTFEQTNAYGLTVRVEYHSPLEQEVRTALAAGTPPDLLVAPCDFVAELESMKAVVSPKEYVTSARLGLSEVDLADLWPVVLERGCLAAHSGQPLGFLLNTEMVVLFYNQAILDDLDVADPPQTWEQFRELCNLAQDKNAGTWGLTVTPEGSTVASWIQSLGGQVLDLDTGQVTFNSAESIAVLSMLESLVQDGCAYCEKEAGASQEAFASGHSLFTFGSTAALSEYSVAAKGADPRLAPIPHSTEQAIALVQGSVASLLRTEPRQQLAAWLFLRWLAQPDSDLQWVQATGSLPMHKSTLNAEEMQPYLEQNPMYKTACDLLANARSGPAIENWDEILALLARAAHGVCETQVGAAQALAAAQEAADSLSTR